MENHSPSRPGRHFLQSVGVWEVVSDVQGQHFCLQSGAWHFVFCLPWLIWSLGQFFGENSMVYRHHFRFQIPPSDLYSGMHESTWTRKVTATLPICVTGDSYWSQLINGPHSDYSPHIPQICSLLKSLQILSKWNQNPILWSKPSRYLLCIFPFKTPQRMQKSPFAEALQESMSKIAELCTHRHRHACSHTHGVGNQRISSGTYLRDHRERLAREDMEIRSDQDVGMLQ